MFVSKRTPFSPLFARNRVPFSVLTCFLEFWAWGPLMIWELCFGGCHLTGGPCSRLQFFANHRAAAKINQQHFWEQQSNNSIFWNELLVLTRQQQLLLKKRDKWMEIFLSNSLVLLFSPYGKLTCATAVKHKKITCRYYNNCKCFASLYRAGSFAGASKAAAGNRYQQLWVLLVTAVGRRGGAYKFINCTLI